MGGRVEKISRRKVINCVPDRRLWSSMPPGEARRDLAAQINSAIQDADAQAAQL
jgi:hypothetical protein